MSNDNLENQHDQHVKNLGEIADQYTEWFMQVMRRLFFVGDQNDITTSNKPEGLFLWLDRARADQMHPDIIDRIEKIHDDLSLIADMMINEALKSKSAPALKKFDKIVTLFEEFTRYVRRLDKDILLEDSGIDTLTGLRSFATLRKDLRREMDRLSRQGKPFCIALVRINKFDEIEKNFGEDISLNCLKSVSQLIIKSLRSFDDAYRLENNDFILSLKQADITGGIRALERFKEELKKDSVCYEANGNKVALSLSSCIAEPLPGDDIKILLENLKFDLESHELKPDVILEYHEISPLQRYVQELQD